MNVQRIFDALRDDSQNSALGIICVELEEQGYTVSINNRKVSSEGFFNEEYKDLESLVEPLEFSLFLNGKHDQSFVIEFVDFHDVLIKAKE